jgi:hypothetical protein
LSRSLQRSKSNQNHYLLFASDYLLFRFLQSNNTELRETALNTIEELQVNITILLECFDTNKIQSFATEEEAVEKGMELLELNKLWAVISFRDIPDANGTLDKLPPFVTYKIRFAFLVLTLDYNF